MTTSHTLHAPALRARVLAAAALLAAGLVVIAPATPPPAAAIGPLPACRLADIQTVPNDYDHWSTTLVDWLLTVGPDYVPPDLVPTSEAGIAGGGLIRAVAIDDLRALSQAAAKAGSPISVISGYRSYQDQVASFNGWGRVRQLRERHHLLVEARLLGPSTWTCHRFQSGRRGQLAHISRLGGHADREMDV